MKGPAESVHGSAVVVDRLAVLIRGPSGSGKSTLALDLIGAGRSGLLPPTRLVGDDRLHLEAREGVLLVWPAPGLEGRIEVYGLGIRRCAYAQSAAVGLVVDLHAPDAARMPRESSLLTDLESIQLPRLPVEKGASALGRVIAWLTTSPDLPPK